ncbi:MAG: molybdopterin-dependent oxidoreductase [Desulfobulbus sp.]|jgi:thiosulfate reductase/polysulfide reductase chain A|uniref:molybdopterin-containing oxidoreductase family protein n=1 Tax=Desulfobulbus sp. TaxID=895 RepID=UPI00283E95CD|nr:molybdopterin-dependent oxidoreductase [Desulfobulbus sp.]MDR2550853.1 molybdopterin-dependent oxidoreductase [Desulfobulbus sp.]
MAMNLTRRTFLKAASIAAASVPLSKVTAQAESGVVKTPLVAPGSFKNTQTAVGGVCEMCFWRCQLVGKIRDGRLVKLEGNPKSIDNGVSICARGNAGVKLLYDPDRLKYPLKNVGKRGAPKWQRITWEEALDTCGSKLKAIADQHGTKGISMFPHGSTATYPMGFFENTVGTHNISEASFFQCRGIRDTAYLATVEQAPNENVDMANAKVIFLVGCHFGENIHVSHVKQYLKGLENGAKLVVVDPRYSASAAKSHIWVQIRPGTDTAFLLAIMNYLIQNKKYNADFVEDYGEGLGKMTEGIKQWTLEKAAQECDVPAAQIKEVAELLAANMPHVSVHPGRHVSWYGNDFQRERALACLTGLLGAFGVKGGFVQPVGPKGLAKYSWPKGEGHDKSLREMANLYHFSPPGTPTDLIRDTAITGKPYPIKGCVIWGQNPIQTIPNQEKTIKMLEQMDFVMCVDVMPTDITMYADILLPDCSYMERYDLIKTGTQWNLAEEAQQYIAPRMPLVAPGFERKDSVYITNEIAKRMGYGEKIPIQTQEEGINKMLAGVQLSIDKIKAEDGIHVQPGKKPYGEMELTVHFYSKEMEDHGYPGIPTYIPVERTPEGYFRLLYGRSPVHTFNRSQNNVWLMAENSTNPVWLNDKQAAKLGLKDGDTVSLVNQDGVKSRTTTTVKVTPGIRQDCVYMYHGFGSMNPELTVGYNKGVDDQSLITKLAVDPETGAHGMRNNFVKLVKVG